VNISNNIKNIITTAVAGLLLTGLTACGTSTVGDSAPTTRAQTTAAPSGTPFSVDYTDAQKYPFTISGTIPNTPNFAFDASTDTITSNTQIEVKIKLTAFTGSTYEPGMPLVKLYPIYSANSAACAVNTAATPISSIDKNTYCAFPEFGTGGGRPTMTFSEMTYKVKFVDDSRYDVSKEAVKALNHPIGWAALIDGSIIWTSPGLALTK